MKKHIRRWNIWREYSTDSKLIKFLVLIKLKASPALMLTFLPEEKPEIFKRYDDGGIL